MISEEDTKGIDIIDFIVSPLGRRIQLVSLKDRDTFDSFMNAFSGIRFKPETDERFEADLFALSNGFLLVDRFNFSKANPFYICKSFDDFLFIDNNLFIYRPYPDSAPVVEYRISQDHLRIKDFLAKPNVFFLRHDDATDQDIFMTDNNQFIITKSVQNTINERNNPFRELSNLFIRPEYSMDPIIYIELSMYESFDMLKRSGTLDNDDDDYLLPRFASRSKILSLYNADEEIACVVCSANEGKRFKKYMVVDDWHLSMTVNDTQYMDGEKGEYVIRYNGPVFLTFYNESDFKKALSFLSDPRSRELNIESLILESMKLAADKFGESLLKRLRGIDFHEKTIDDILDALDSEMNKYFWDNTFIKRYFLEILGFAGHVLQEKTGGRWEYSSALGRSFFKLKDGCVLDIVPIFADEAQKQKHSGNCSIGGIVSTLLIMSKLKVGVVNNLY